MILNDNADGCKENRHTESGIVSLNTLNGGYLRGLGRKKGGGLIYFSEQICMKNKSVARMVNVDTGKMTGDIRISSE